MPLRGRLQCRRPASYSRRAAHGGEACRSVATAPSTAQRGRYRHGARIAVSSGSGRFTRIITSDGPSGGMVTNVSPLGKPGPQPWRGESRARRTKFMIS
jgi:hypothetical protein